jgi:heptaprenyl diphosphate synthase
MNERSILLALPDLSAEIDALEALLAEEFRGGGFIQQTAAALVLGGGKRLRPALTIASAHVGSYQRQSALPVAAAMEVLHTATLVHDDVIDHSDTRRGSATLHTEHGNHIAIYAGDYLLAKALILVSRSTLPMQEMSRLASAIEMMCMGEVAQYLGRNTIPGFREYLKRIMSKTGILFAASCAAGGRAGGLEEKDVMRLWQFGMRFGTAFQIRDDLLDIDQSSGKAGKPTGRDLLDGIITLPVLLAAQDAVYSALLSAFLTGQRTMDGALELVDLARQAGAVEKAADMLAEQLKKGKEILYSLPQSRGREMMGAITELLYAKP